MSNNDFEYKGGLLKSPYDSRDYRFKDLRLGGVFIPDEYESEEFPFVYDQGRTMMCCACAYSALRYLQESDNITGTGLTEPFSPTFTYGNREPDEDFEGMYLRSCCKRGRYGSLLLRELNEWCSTQKAMLLVNQKKEEYFKKAEPYKISSFYVCRSREEIQTAIYTTKGVIIGIPTYKSLNRPDANGIVRYNPRTDVNDNGGHAVLLTGWKIINGKFHWRMLNSWGRKWGQNGYCWLPEEYPWMEDAYAIVDDLTNKRFEEYLKENYNN